jgi:hypothetical protein
MMSHRGQTRRYSARPFHNPQTPLINVAVYRGPAGLPATGPLGQSPGGVADYEQWIGRPLFAAEEYLATDTMTNQTWPGWQSGPWGATGRRMIIGGCGVPVTSPTSPAATTYASTAAGDYDATWVQMCSNLKQSGQHNPILRPAHEFNGNFYYSTLASNDLPNFIASWRRFVDIVRENLPGAQICWNPTITGGNSNYQSYWPGAAYVDQIGLDCYDTWYGTSNGQWNYPAGPQPSAADRQGVWNTLLTQLNILAAMGEQYGIPICFPEWGVDNGISSYGYIQEGGDNAYFVQQVNAWSQANNVIWAAYWEQPTTNGVFDPDAPRVAANLPPMPQTRAAFYAAVAATGAAPPTITAAAPPAGTHAVAYPGYQFAATGVPAVSSWSVASGVLPAGLTLSAAGDLTGTPTTAGTYTFRVSALNITATTTSPTITVTIA